MRGQELWRRQDSRLTAAVRVSHLTSSSCLGLVAICSTAFESCTPSAQALCSPPSTKKAPSALCFVLAEAAGFEPADPFRGQHISSVLLSTTEPRLHL